MQTLIEELAVIGEVRQPGFLMRIEGDNYRIERTRYPFNPHFLSIVHTSEERLQAHWDGYRTGRKAQQ